MKLAANSAKDRGEFDRAVICQKTIELDLYKEQETVLRRKLDRLELMLSELEVESALLRLGLGDFNTKMSQLVEDFLLRISGMHSRWSR